MIGFQRDINQFHCHSDQSESLRSTKIAQVVHGKSKSGLIPLLVYIWFCHSCSLMVPCRTGMGKLLPMGHSWTILRGLQWLSERVQQTVHELHFMLFTSILGICYFIFFREIGWTMLISSVNINCSDVNQTWGEAVNTHFLTRCSAVFAMYRDNQLAGSFAGCMVIFDADLSALRSAIHQFGDVSTSQSLPVDCGVTHWPSEHHSHCTDDQVHCCSH